MLYYKNITAPFSSITEVVASSYYYFCTLKNNRLCELKPNWNFPTYIESNSQHSIVSTLHSLRHWPPCRNTTIATIYIYYKKLEIWWGAENIKINDVINVSVQSAYDSWLHNSYSTLDIKNWPLLLYNKYIKPIQLI